MGLLFEGVVSLKEDSKMNPGNFLTILEEVACYHLELNQHSEQPLYKDVTYIAPTGCNGFIYIIDKKVIWIILGCVNLERLTGKYKGETLLSSCDELGISVKEFRGQCYDGGQNMQSVKKRYFLINVDKSLKGHCDSLLLS